MSPNPGIDFHLSPTPHLPDRAALYHTNKSARRPSSDPIGLCGLPDNRRELNQLLVELCRRLLAAEGRRVRGPRLAESLGLAGCRALRKLVAYGHVQHHLRQVVGLPGQGYCWAPLAAGDVYRAASRQAARLGECHFFLATLYGRQPPATQIVQLIFDFARPVPPAEDAPLRALLAARGVGPEQLADAMIQQLRETPRGRQILHRLGRRHHDVLLPADTLQRIRSNLHKALEELPVPTP